MTNQHSSFAKWYYNFLQNSFHFRKLLKIVPIDYQKSWLQLFWIRPVFLVMSLFLWIVSLVWDNLAPLLITYFLAKSEYEFLVLAALGYGLRFLVSALGLFLLVVVDRSALATLRYNVGEFFLTVDPVAHSTRSSGEIVSKISRGEDSWNVFFSDSYFKLVPVLVSVITVSISLFSIHVQLGITSLLLNLVLFIISTTLLVYNGKTLVPFAISLEDKHKHIQLETIQQAPHIRSVFAGGEQIKKLIESGCLAAEIQSIRLFSGVFIGTILRMVFSIGIFIFAWVMYSLVNSGELSNALAIGAVIVYLNMLIQVVDIGGTIERIVTNYLNNQDLFEFIRTFGKQTYPVLQDDQIKMTKSIS